MCSTCALSRLLKLPASGRQPRPQPVLRKTASDCMLKPLMPLNQLCAIAILTWRMALLQQGFTCLHPHD